MLPPLIFKRVLKNKLKETLMSTNTTPLKIIGKEFLYDENLFITNYNPFLSTNTSGIQGLYSSKSFTGKLYIFDKTNYNEPTREQFINIKMISEMSQFKKEAGIPTINYFTVTINTDYTIKTSTTPSLRSLSLDKNASTLSIVPNIGTQPASIFDKCFCVFIIDKDTINNNDKTYADMTSLEQNFMWLLPESVITTTGSLTEGITLNITNPSKRSVTKTSGFYSGPFEEKYPGYTENMCKPYRINSSLNGNLVPDNLPTLFTTTTDLPEYAGWSKFVSYNNYVYWIGGYNLTGASVAITTSIRRAPINENGDIGTYINIGTTPANIGQAQAFIIKDKLWLVGCLTATITYTLNTYWCQINEDGSLGTWNSGPVLPDNVGASNGAVIVNNKIYFFGGYTTSGTVYKNHIICGDIGSDGLIKLFYKLSTTMSFLVSDVSITFSYGNKIFIIPGYNKTTSAYDTNVYSFIVNPDGTLQNMINENNPFTNIAGLHTKILLIGSKVWAIGGTNTATTGYTENGMVADLNIINGEVKLSTWRNAGAFPIAMHGCDGIIITKKYIYLYPLREGVTWVNSKKVYRADISSYNIGSKNDYSQDSFHYKNTIVLPSFYNKYNSTNLGGVLDNTFVDGSFTLSIPQYKLKSDGTYILITDEEILSYVQSIKVNNNPLTLITNSDITIQRPSDQTLETGKSLKVQVQVLIDEELLQTINYLSEYNKPDLFGDGSCKAWYQFNGNMYDSIRGIDTDGLGVSGLTTDTNLNVTYGYNPTAVRKTYLGSGSNVNAQTQTLGNPHGNSTTVTISAWLMWNGVDNGVPFGILDTSNGAFRQCLYFKTAFMGLNTANGDVYGISSTGFSGVWKHVVIQFNTGSYGKLWIDGVAQTLTQKLTTPIVGNQTVAGNTAYIFLTGYANFGNIDDLRVFDRALTDIEVKSLYRESSLSVSPDQTKLFVKDPAYPALTDKYISNDITIDKINYINGRPWEQQYYIDRPDPSNLTFTTDTSLPFVCAWGEVALVKNKVYIFGGSRSGANNTAVNVSTINVASINEDGTIGTFVVSPSVLPVVMQQPKVLVIGSRIYLFGGVNTVYLATVYSCAINSDGTLGSWRTETSLPYASVIPNIIITKNRLYLLGGCTTSAVMNNTIYTCNINDDGSLGTWINTKNTYPILTYSSCVTQIKNKIYVIGGIASTTTLAGLNNIYTATINDDGTITTFTSVGTFPTNICSANCFTTKTRIYVIGGIKDSTTGIALNQVYSAPIDINGNIGTWVAGPVLPYAKHCSNDLVVTSTYIYLLGGREYVSSGVWKDTAKVLRAPLSGGKNDYTDDTYDTIQYTTVSKKLNYIEQKQLTINASTKLDSLNPGITIDSVALDYNAKPTVIGMDFDTGTSLFEAPQLSSNQTTGVLVNTGKKVYLYGGRSDNSAALTATISNTLWVSNILNDGSLEGFTNIGTNSINLYDVSTYTYTTPTGQTFAYAFGGYTPGLTTNINTVSSIRRSLITADGSLGNWTIIDNIPYSCAANIIIVNPEDPSCFWLFVGDSYAAGVYTSYRNRVCYYKINVDGSLKLIYNQTLDQNYCTNANYVARDPKDNNLYLFMFGTEYAGDANIRKYRVNDSGYISTTGVIVGTIDHAKHSTYLMEDSDNVYVIGGVANYTGWKIGADNRVLKYSKQALMEATTNNPLGPVMEPTLSVPLNVAYYMMIKTPYAYYAVCPYTSSTTDGSAYTYQTTNRVFGFKINSSSLGSTGLTMIDTSFKISNDDLNNSEGLYKIIPNKLNNRLREELFSNLLVRSTQTLTRFGETIKFKDPVNGNIITLTDNTNPNAISQNEKFLIEYLVKLAVTDNLDKYNNYAYTNLYGQNTTGDYDLIIPELIFNIITDRNCVNLNKTVLTEYLNDATLNPASLGLTIPVGFNLDDSLYVLYKNKITSNTSTPITYTTTGMNLNMVKPLTIGYGAKLNEVSHIFIPQRNKSKVLNSSGFPFIPKNANYIDSTGSCVYKKKIADALIDYKTNEKVIQSYFNFFVSPTGNNANDGLTPYTPKATVGGCTDGTKVLLLPGTYTGIAADSNYGAYNKFASVFAGMNAHEVWGCGDSTIIDVPNGVSGIGLKSSVVPTRVAGTASLNNVKVIWRNTYQASEKDRWVVSYLSLQNGYARACGFTFYKVNFANQAGTVYNLAGWADNTRTDASDYIYFNNCTITGGTRLGVYVMELGLIQSVAEKSFYSTIGNNPMIPTHKNLIDNITDTIEFIPAYTMIPLSDDSDPQINTMVLENKTNITNIPNFSINL